MFLYSSVLSDAIPIIQKSNADLRAIVLNEPTSRIRAVEQSAVDTLETHRWGKERFDHLSSKRAKAKNQRIDPADNLASKDTNLDYNPQSDQNRNKTAKDAGRPKRS